MAPHTRTRTGCWTCREAGYKCDEQKPYCGRCTRLKITCKGYSTKLKWKNASTASGPKRRSRDTPGRSSMDRATTVAERSPSSTASVASAPIAMEHYEMDTFYDWKQGEALIPSAMPVMAPDLPAHDRTLLHYWINHLSSLISASPRSIRGSPFQVHLTSMTCTPGALRSTVLSMAATHLALQIHDPSLRFQAYKHQCDAIKSLQQLLLDPIDTASEPGLATVLMMQVSARLFGDEDAEPQVANHLLGAKAMVARRGGSAAWRSSSNGRFLLSLFAYHDILASVSRSARPLLDYDCKEFVAVEDEPNTESIAQVLQIVARISGLQDTARLAGTRNRIETAGAELEMALLSLQCPYTTSSQLGQSEEQNVQLTAEAYRHAAFIYLYRVWRGIGAPHPETLIHVDQCLNCLERVDIDSSLISSHVWPLWTAGCEAIDLQQRSFVRARFQAMYRSRLFPSLKRIVRDVDDVWAAKDAEQLLGGEEGMKKVECMSVIRRRRGREVDLA
ncbi:fungal-specific transcription factor domain-containing protein [Lophiotrema nucula]|uniref:Fungal-specific transcription factor domain-containing protein n=1 Tax=Lophiotrema nucula TaxID=690887 RepID=A0A6A5YVI9_9PLEO|nr:fungal-specific transcription factor domain-containing protein [Lophiotrema nucula]